MKTLYKTLSLLILFSLFSCKEKAAEAPAILEPKSSFDSPFPKRNKNLSNILGEEITIKSYGDTLRVKITSTKNDNLITYQHSGDTLFFGKVCKYRGLYYFNQKVNDSSYHVFSVKISDNLIYGLTDWYSQLYDLDHKIEKGFHKKLVKHINRDTTIIRLHPDKKEMKYLYSSLISTYPPDTIINYGKRKTDVQDKTNSVTTFEPDESDNLLKVYPNPAKDFINVNLQQKNKSFYQFADINGKTILQGYLNEIENKIDLDNQQRGIYLLTVTNLKNQERETVKIIVD